MAVIPKAYGPLLTHLFNGLIAFTTDTIKVSLHTDQYTPNQDTDDFFNDVTGEVAIVSTTLSSSASAGATTISVAASVAVGNVVTIGGTEQRKVSAVSGAGPYTLTIPALTSAWASGTTVASGTGYTAGGVTLASKALTYTAGTNTLTVDAADVSIAASSIGARYAVIRKDTGTSSTSPLIAYADFGQDIISLAAAFAIQWDPAGILSPSTP